MMYCLWECLLKKRHILIRATAIFTLFFSGFISLVAGIFTAPGFDIGQQSTWQAVATATRNIPVSAVFVAYPTFNHPISISGHCVVMGYAATLFTHGINYTSTETKLTKLMNAEVDWQRLSKDLGVDYLFWGPLERQNYSKSTRLWEKSCPLVAEGFWGRIYDTPTDHGQNRWLVAIIGPASLKSTKRKISPPSEVG